MPATWSGVVLRTTLAGIPTTSELGGMVAPSGTSAPAPTMDPRPIVAPVSTVGVHSDQDLVFDSRAVNDGVVPNDDALAHDDRMSRIDVQRRVILDVAIFAYGDGLVVAAKYGVEPDAGAGGQGNSAHDLGSRRYVSIGCNGRIISLESQNHWLSSYKMLG